jgi:hypothetical protein
MWPSPKRVQAESAGVAKWLKAQGLGPCHEGVRGFDSRPPHIVTSICQVFSCGFINLFGFHLLMAKYAILHLFKHGFCGNRHRLTILVDLANFLIFLSM